MTLKLENSVDKKTYIYTNLTDLADSRIFFHFDLILDDGMPDGSYNYFLYDVNDIQVASGILQIGDYNKTVTTYTKNNTYVQYNG